MSFLRTIESDANGEQLTLVSCSNDSLLLNAHSVSPNCEGPFAFVTIPIKQNQVKELILGLNDWLLTLEQGGATA